MSLYRIYSWDHDVDGWVLEAEAPTLWALRPVLAHLRSETHGASAIMVESVPGEFVVLFPNGGRYSRQI